MLKTQNIFNIRPAEFVDRLVIIADNAEIAVFCRQKAHKAELNRVGILILIDHDIAELLLIIIEHFRELLE